MEIYGKVKKVSMTAPMPYVVVDYFGALPKPETFIFYPVGDALKRLPKYPYIEPGVSVRVIFSFRGIVEQGQTDSLYWTKLEAQTIEVILTEQKVSEREPINSEGFPF